MYSSSSCVGGIVVSMLSLSGLPAIVQVQKRAFVHHDANERSVFSNPIARGSRGFAASGKLFRSQGRTSSR